MKFSHPHRRALHSLLSVLVCAAAVLCSAQTTMAGFLLSGDEAVASEPSEELTRTASNDADNLAAYLPATTGSRRIDLSVASTSGPGTTSSSRQAPAQTTHDPASADNAEVDSLTAFSGNSASHAGGAAAPNGSTASGAPAAILAANHSPSDLQVTGWLRDANRLSMPSSMPRTLLRPPRV